MLLYTYSLTDESIYDAKLLRLQINNCFSQQEGWASRTYSRSHRGGSSCPVGTAVGSTRWAWEGLAGTLRLKIEAGNL